MATHIQTVHIPISKEIEREKKIDEIRQQQKVFQVEPATDSLQIDTSMDVASQAEVEELKLSGRSPHDSLKEGRKDLKGEFERAGAKFTEAEIEGEKIGKFASKMIEETDLETSGEWRGRGGSRPVGGDSRPPAGLSRGLSVGSPGNGRNGPGGAIGRRANR